MWGAFVGTGMVTDEFKIADEALDTDATDLIDDHLRHAVEELETKRLRVLALAFHNGHDGVDIIPNQKVSGRVDDFKISFQYEAWNGEPPARDRFDPVTRYDFRHLGECEERELLAHIGVTPDE
jgi:hypothetical protein